MSLCVAPGQLAKGNTTIESRAAATAKSTFRICSITMAPARIYP
jgi:hypothetical protein